MTELCSSTFLKARTSRSASSGKMVPSLCGIIESLLIRQSRTTMFITRTKVFVTASESLCKVRNLLVFMDWNLSSERDMIDAEISISWHIMIDEVCSIPSLLPSFFVYYFLNSEDDSFSIK